MPDQIPQISTIDDLVKDLVKSGPSSNQNNPTYPQMGAQPYSPPPLAPQVEQKAKPVPSSPPTTPNIPQQSIKELPASKLTLPSLPKSPAQKQPAERPKIQEYQSTIRTLSEDLERLKMGQKLGDTEVKKRVLSPESPIPNISLPQDKPKDLAFKAPLSPSQTPVKQVPPVDVFKPPLEKGPKPLVQTPPKKETSDNVLRKPLNYKLILPACAVAMAAVGIYFYYAYFNQRSEPIPTASTQASPKETPTPRPTKDLNALLGNIQEITFTIPKTGNPTDIFYKALNDQSVNKGEFKKLKMSDENNQPYGVISLFDRFFINYPTGLKESIGTDSAVLLYGQVESYNTNGQLITSGPTPKKLVILLEIQDRTKASSAMTSWEPNIIDGLTNLLQLDPKTASTPNFLDNIYSGVNIRYRNFQFPDKSIDYAFQTANNGKTYLIISNSREAIYAIITKLK